MVSIAIAGVWFSFSSDGGTDLAPTPAEGSTPDREADAAAAPMEGPREGSRDQRHSPTFDVAHYSYGPT